MSNKTKFELIQTNNLSNFRQIGFPTIFVQMFFDDFY